MKIRLSIRQHNKLFKYRKVKLLTFYEITDDVQNKDIEMRQYIRLPVRVISIVLSPLAILFGGIPAMIRLVKECWNKTEVGADTIDREWFYSQLNKMKEDK